jgi:hypothetical protein
MLETLQFVQGAVSTKTAEPMLKHFQIQSGVVQAYNGVVGLRSPIDCDLDVRPLAAPFVNAIKLCKDTVTLHITDTGRLAVRSEDFRAYIDTTENEFPDIRTGGEALALEGGVQECLRSLHALMSDDASRPWSRGILFAKQSAYATNNIILAEHWLGYDVPQPFGLPTQCVNELLRIGEEPIALQTDGRTITFTFEGDRVLTSNLIEISKWPDPSALLGDVKESSPVDASLFTTLDNLRPFLDDLRRVWLTPDGMVSTGAPECEEGAHMLATECAGMQGKYSADQLAKLGGIAQSVAWQDWPKPCAWYGDNIRGVIVGLA